MCSPVRQKAARELNSTRQRGVLLIVLWSCVTVTTRGVWMPCDLVTLHARRVQAAPQHRWKDTRHKEATRTQGWDEEFARAHC